MLCSVYSLITLKLADLPSTSDTTHTRAHCLLGIRTTTDQSPITQSHVRVHTVQMNFKVC